MATGKIHAHEQLFTSLDRSVSSVGVGVSVQEVVNHYLQTVHVKYLSPRTVEEYSYELHTFAQWCAQKRVVQHSITKQWTIVSGETKLHQVNDQAVYLFLEHLKATHTLKGRISTIISNCTLASYVRVIKTFLMWCLLDDYYGQHIKPGTIYRIKKPPVIRRPMEILSRGQVKAMFAACEKEESEYLQVRDRAILAVLLDTGIRAKELTDLRMGNVCLDPLDAHMKVLGKGGKWGEVVLGVKTQEYLQKYIQMFREPAIQQGVAQLLRKQQEQKRYESFLFVNRRGDPMGRSGLWRMTQRLGEWANINSALCVPHVFRRTFAVNFMRQDGNIYRLSKLLRHSSVDVTEVYLASYLQSEARRGAKSVLDNL